MKHKLCDINASATDKLPPKADDKSGIGVHYIDAYIKPMNVKLPDSASGGAPNGTAGGTTGGTLIKCKRRGLKITLQVGTRKGEGLMRRLDVSPDPVIMLDHALKEAAKNAGVELTIDADGIYINDPMTQ